jgi:ferrous iron transport protein B
VEKSATRNIKNMNASLFSIGIAGNPNCGKTTVFNALTGARQRVGNWPGVTVERKIGHYRDGDLMEVIDLPGVYTLGSLPGIESLDERIAQDAILQGEARVIVNVVDASNLERGLYLTAQLLEMRIPMVIAVNMMDLSRKQGITIDSAHLSEQLGCRVVPVVASRGEGIDELKTAIRETAAECRPPAANIGYGQPLEKAIAEITPVIARAAKSRAVEPRWLAAKLLEGDAVASTIASSTADAVLARLVPALEAEQGEDADILIADARYAFANNLARQVVGKTGAVRRPTSDNLDKLVLNRWLGLPIFLGLMYLMFMFTINLGGAFVDFFDQASATLFVNGLGALLTTLDSPDWLRVLLADGLGGGIQVVATFIPIIGFLYLFLSVLEDTGYMARAAFLMDRYMRIVGLPGKAFVPLIIGFGCNVPAIMATRTLEQQRDRTMSVLMTPFMSCGARLAVYALFTAAFFPVGGQNVVFGLYLAGVAAAIGTGFVLKHTLLTGETTAFIMELPPYHVPNAKSVLLHTWGRLKSFIFGAGKIIVVVVVALSFLNSMGTDGSFGNEDSDRSALSATGRAIIPAFKPLGIKDDNWPAAVGIFTGVFAKEAVVGTLNALYLSLDKSEAIANGEVEEAFDLWAGLAAAIATIPKNLAAIGDLIADPLGIGAAGIDGKHAAAEAQDVSLDTFGAMVLRFDGAAGALAYLLFVLLYIPCVATLGAINREVGARWTTFAACWTMGVAYAVSVCFYQAATFASHPVTSSAWIGGMAAAVLAAILGLRFAGRRKVRLSPVLAAE